MRRRGYVSEINFNEVMQGTAYGLEGVNVSYVGSRERVTLVDGFVEEGATLAAEGDGGKVVKLGACAAHGGKNGALAEEKVREEEEEEAW